jgi:hypothetical protein
MKRKWIEMEAIRNEPCAHCGQKGHVRSCIAEVKRNATLAMEAMVKADDVRVNELAQLRFTLEDRAVAAERRALAAEAGREEMERQLAEYKAKVEAMAKVAELSLDLVEMATKDGA